MSEVTTLGLTGRVALVTGVSRRIGIGFALARRLLDDGATVMVSGWQPHDAEMPWGADPGGPTGVLAALGTGRPISQVDVDLEQPDGPDTLVAAAVERFGAIDIVVANHARSSSHDLDDVTVDELDRCWAANTRASVLLAKALSRHHDDRRPGGRLVLFTSGQHLEPMAGELAYAVSKGAIHQMTPALADQLADRGITVNCINPGPVDTGYANAVDRERVASMFPAKRWGSPDDVARLVAWLVSDEAAWVTGQVINSEGGFRRWSPPAPR